ncbi:tRNA (guanine(37)-N1)-methyltransferase isoform X3 [Nilaparvata lugens]|uniref:tRNA (guanine(37)-N1)-methyltransferase isoform X3 n=1 Tax=Nilaparvata lugens TaxID=108931 RepID=UPI00193D3B9F|nr:tRNA (guanine(37)-N1)-methyltransferase isoform X3 [Nilaparvata lugens]
MDTCNRGNSNMSSSEDIKRTIRVPPETCRGLKNISDKSVFTKSTNVPCLITCAKNIGKLHKILRKYLIHLRNFKPVTQYIDNDGTPDEQKRTILLDPDIIFSFDSFLGREKEEMKNVGVTEDDFRFTNLEITYDNWLLNDLIKAVLPLNLNFSGFTVVGHIAHLNLREELLEYKHTIAQILIDSVPGVKTVVNKLDSISEQFRHFKMELLAGEDNFDVTVKANQCVFEFNFKKVYWNSRLTTEHSRLVNTLRSCDVLYDVCCGVGPFAVMAAKKGCKVLANDLNPDAITYLNKNISLNKLKGLIEPFNMDGNDFIKTVIKNHLLKNTDKETTAKRPRANVVINLPESSHTLLKSFLGIFSIKEFTDLRSDVILHVYVFVKGDGKGEHETTPSETNVSEREHEAKELVRKGFGVELSDDVMEVFYVRHVSPTKDMVRVTLKLGIEVLVDRGTKRKHEDSCTDLN